MSELDAIETRDAADAPQDAPGERIVSLRSAPNADKVRLDQFITRSIQNASRTKVHALIEAGGVTVNGRSVTKPGRFVLANDVVICVIPKPPPPDVLPEDIPLNIVYEDADILIVNKPAGMVTHPAHGNYSGTLVNALLHHTGSLSMERGPEKAGVVHRLDKGTSGLLCVAKNEEAHRFLSKQFAAHTIEREYWAVIWGRFKDSTGTIDAAVARHKSDRKKMAVVEDGKYAVTTYTLQEDYQDLSLVRLRLKTGRTHQIRVHLSHMRHPVFGDPTYGGRRILYGTVTARYKTFINMLLDILPRQALHAKSLGFIHPRTKELVRFESELPADMQQAVDALHAYAAA